MTMTVRELREELERFDPDAEVRLMEQPSWPFEYSVAGVWSPDDSEDPDRFEPDGRPVEVVYLTEGSQLAYGTREAWS